MKRSTTLTINAVIFLLVVGLGAAAAQGFGDGQGRRGGCDGPRSEMRLERMKAHLELSEEQVTAIEALLAEGRQVGQDLRKEMARVRNEMEGEMLKDKPSQKAMLDLNAKMGDLRTKQRAERISQRFAVRELLTEDQQAKMLGAGGFGGRGHKGGRQGKGGCGSGRSCHAGAGQCGNRGSNR